MKDCGIDQWRYLEVDGLRLMRRSQPYALVSTRRVRGLDAEPTLGLDINQEKASVDFSSDYSIDVDRALFIPFLAGKTLEQTHAGIQGEVCPSGGFEDSKK